MRSDYQRIRRAIAGEIMPVAVVDLDAVERNATSLLEPVKRSADKTLRIASKSIRCLDLLAHVIDYGGDVMKGVMSFSVREAAYLVANGHPDVFVAYPTALSSDARILAGLNDQQTTVSIAVDDLAHLECLEAAAADANTSIPVVIDVDMSLRLMGDRVHVGVRRSPLGDADEVLALARATRRFEHLRLHGVMGYEAQIAGVTDKSPFSPALNTPKRLMKHVSRRHVAKTRRAIADDLKKEGFDIELFNGGGSGSITWTTEEDWLTEVTAGSGFVDSHLFDYYADLSLTPAIFFGVQVVRRPARNIVTCHGGGYVASGEIGPDRLPVPYLPEGLSLMPLEGAGEVQTPLVVPDGVSLEIGDPVFFRHAKAGELAEHFDEYLFIRGDEVVKRAKTYRGDGQRFL